ncbi:PIG-L deacetylase family protein [Frateuria defendens]|uniref:PIG-L deacetylase family protein n=1 Tax=Frateuria defendens TaxID=2219559 RepID=UPI0009E2C1C6|nr:PIG-L family deacetylase [Frateuria defendens]
MTRQDDVRASDVVSVRAGDAWELQAAGAQPTTLRAEATTRLLVVAPHPDDETIGAGELIQQVREAGGAVRVLLLTDGDDNPWPQRWLERRLWIGEAERRRWGRRRREEVAAALDRLGLDAASHLQALGWPDMGVTGLLQRQGTALLAPLLAQLDDFRPSLVVMPALDDHHPDHGAAHVIARLAVAAWGGEPALLGYLVHGRPTGAGPEVGPAPAAPRHAVKLAALDCHHSQLALSAKRMHRLAGRPERFRAPAGPGGDSRLPWRPPAPWRRLLRLTVADGEGVRDWRWHEAPLERSADGGFRLAGQGAGPRFAKLYLDLPSPWIFDHWGWCEF